MARLFNFDYKTPFFYMVTLKRLPGLADFSRIAEDGRLVRNAITIAFERTICTFHEKWRCIEPISPFIVMPDHIHLMIKIKPTADRVALGVIVSQMSKALRNEYWKVVAADAATRKTPGIAHHCLAACAPGVAACAPGVAACAPSVAACASAQACGQSRDTPPRNTPPRNTPPRDIFSKEWHDWIVKKDGQLAAFTRYIRENAERAWLRRVNRRYFGQVRKVSFLGREWFAYGNTAILELPVLKAVKGHRTTKPGSAEWEAMVADCGRIGPGGAGVGTFMSPLEKECGNAIAASGGKWVVLSPEGFYDRWHPPREKERFCAEGRMLFLSLYPSMDRLPTKQELYRRCHEMGDLAVAGLEQCGGTGPAAQNSSAVLPAPSGNDQ